MLLLGIELPVNYGPQYRDGLRAIYADLARTRHTALVPFLLEGVALDPAHDAGRWPASGRQRPSRSVLATRVESSCSRC